MKKNPLKLVFGIIATLWVAGLLWLSIPGVEYLSKSAIPMAMAQQALAPKSNSGTGLFCKRDFGNFLKNGIDFDGEGFTDYWRDIFVIYNTNYCQFTDIDSLLNRIDKARKQLREAFYVCDNSTAQKVAQQYYDMSAELYYVRHFVDTPAPTNPDASNAEKAQNVALRTDVKNKFIKKFVTDLKYFNDADGAAEFDKFVQKYSTKIDTYKNCSDPNFGALIQKIKDLGTTLDTIQQLGQKFVDRTNKVMSKMEARVAASPGLLSVFSADSVGDFFNKAVSVRVNGENFDSTTTWEQISQTAKTNAPGYYGNVPAAGSPITQNFIAGDLSNIQKRDEANNLDLTYMAEYDLKYRQTSGLGLDKLLVNLDALQAVILSTYDPMTKIQVCAANIVGKQCGG